MVAETVLGGCSLSWRVSKYRIITVTPDTQLSFRYRIDGAETKGIELSLAINGFARGEIGRRLVRGTQFAEVTVATPPAAAVWRTASYSLAALEIPAGCRLTYMDFRVKGVGGESVKFYLDDVFLFEGVPPESKTPPALIARKQPENPLSTAPREILTRAGPKLRSFFPKSYRKGVVDQATMDYFGQIGFNTIWIRNGNPLYTSWPDSEKFKTKYLPAYRRASRAGLQIVTFDHLANVLLPEPDGDWSGSEHAGPLTSFKNCTMMVYWSGKTHRYPCPVDDDYWAHAIMPWYTKLAELSKEVALVGFGLDFEIYKERIYGMFSYCFCDNCIARFRQASQVAVPQLATDKRHSWLKSHDHLDAYHKNWDHVLVSHCRALRAAVDRVNPKLFFWIIPWENNNPFLNAWAKGVTSDQAPVVLTTESTYGQNYYRHGSGDLAIQANVSFVLKEMAALRKEGFPYRYAPATAGFWGSAEFQARSAVAMSRVADGYWHFENMYQDDRPPGWRRNDYYRAYAHANIEISKGTFREIKLVPTTTDDTPTRTRAGPKFASLFPKSHRKGICDQATMNSFRQLGFNTIWIRNGNPLNTKWLDSEKFKNKYFPAYGRAGQAGLKVITYDQMANVLLPEPDGDWGGPDDTFDFNPFRDCSAIVYYNGKTHRFPCPVDDDYWQNGILPWYTKLAELSKDTPLAGFGLDFEVYLSKHLNTFAYCFCNKCIDRFRTNTDSNVPDMPAAERYPWLRDNELLGSYRRSWDDVLLTHCRALRAAVDSVNPDLYFWIIPWDDIPFLAVWAKGVTSDRAPVVLTTEGTYGQAARRLGDDDLGIRANVNYAVAEMASLKSAAFPHRYVPATAGFWGSGEFQGRSATAMSRITDGYWHFENAYKKRKPGWQRDDYYSAYAHANVEILFGTYNQVLLGGIRPTRLFAGADVAPVPAEKIGVVLSGGAKLAPLVAKLFPDSLVVNSGGIKFSKELSRNVRLVVLQNYNVSLKRDSIVGEELRAFVEQGGRLFLTHDTGWYLESPFPEIVKEAFAAPERLDGRHIYDFELTIEGGHPVSAGLEGKRFDSSFHDHITFHEGPQGAVIVRDRYGYSVMVAGRIGAGRVAFSGCHYGAGGPLTPLEEKTVAGVLDWLMAE